MKAAVLYERGTPLKVEEIEILEPRQGEVLVRLGASGVCHSDLHVVNGQIPSPLPIILGHEAAGTVERVGEGVTVVKPGDHVVLSFMPSCGLCRYCTTGRPHLCDVGARSTAAGTLFDGTVRFRKGDQEIKHMSGVASFGQYTVANQESCIPIREDVPFDRACLVGCGVMTGVGAVINTAKVEPGSSVVVIGAGGVGLNVIQGAVLAGAEKIIAVDMLDNKLEMAQQFGATHVINAGREDPARSVRRLTGGGADYAFEVIGNVKTIRQAYDAVQRGGTAVVVGVAAVGAEVGLPAFSLPMMEKTLKGSFYGSTRPRVDMPKLIDLYLAGKLKLDELITRTIPLDAVNEAFGAMERGEVARSVIVY
ncbi:MAG TPA: Zn-dependent alcohol dehydrogenase [Dehalococcoidia bacterium]|nr:Zn-dependent alcohol dehydrogenase [Dehalococcoidia bacterium]